MDVARHDLLAGAALAADQHRCLGTRHLLGPANGGQHDRVARDHQVALAGGRLQDRRDQFGVWRQRQEFLSTVADGLHRGFRVRIDTACDDGDRDPLGGERPHEAAQIMGEIAQHNIHASIGPEPGEGGGHVVRLVQPGAAGDRHAGGLPEFARERADDQNPHDGVLMARDRL